MAIIGKNMLKVKILWFHTGNGVYCYKRCWQESIEFRLYIYIQTFDFMNVYEHFAGPQIFYMKYFFIRIA